jgi:hypothetical protein
MWNLHSSKLPRTSFLASGRHLSDYPCAPLSFLICSALPSCETSFYLIVASIVFARAAIANFWLLPRPSFLTYFLINTPIKRSSVRLYRYFHALMVTRTELAVMLCLFSELIEKVASMSD